MYIGSLGFDGYCAFQESRLDWPTVNKGGACNRLWPSSYGSIEDSLGKAVDVQMNFIGPPERDVSFSRRLAEELIRGHF